MRFHNRCDFTGHLGKDVEYGQTQNGGHKARVSLAVQDNWRDQNGEWQKRTNWLNLVFYGDTAKRAASLTKGTRIRVECKISTWQNDQNRTVTDFIVQQYEITPRHRREESFDSPVDAQYVETEVEGEEGPDLPEGW